MVMRMMTMMLMLLLLTLIKVMMLYHIVVSRPLIHDEK